VTTTRHRKRIPIWALNVESFGGPELAVITARGLWVAIYYYAFLAVFSLAAAIPHRAADDPGEAPSATGGPSSTH
jgi:hypothetical protein